MDPLSDRIREGAVDDYIARVRSLRQEGHFSEALKLVDGVIDHFRLHREPELMRLRAELVAEAGDRAGFRRSPDDPNIRPFVQAGRQRHDVSMPPSPGAVVAPAENSVLEQLSTGCALPIETTQRLPAPSESRFGASLRRFSPPKIYQVILITVPIALVVVAVVLRSVANTNTPRHQTVGTAIIRSAVPAHKEQTNSSPVLATFDIGQTVDLLDSLPLRDFNAWVLVHPQNARAKAGYVPLNSLEELQTADAAFNLWHAAAVADQETDPSKAKQRFAQVERILQANPPTDSAEADRFSLHLSESYVKLAKAESGEVDMTMLVRAKAALDRIRGPLILTERAGQVLAEMWSLSNGTVFGRLPQTITKPVESPRRQTPQHAQTSERARPTVQSLLDAAKAADSDGQFERAVALANEALTRSPRNAAAEKIKQEAQRKILTKILNQ